MKTMKKALSLLLCCALLAAFAPLAHARDTLLEEVWVYYTVPKPGETFDYDSVRVPEGAHYTAEIASILFDGLQGEAITEDDEILYGYVYTIVWRFTPESGYRIDLDKTVFYINDRDAYIIENFDMPVSTFTALADTSPDDDLPFIPGGLPNYWEILLRIIKDNPLWAIACVLMIPLIPFIEVYEWVSGLISNIRDRLFPDTAADPASLLLT